MARTVSEAPAPAAAVRAVFPELPRLLRDLPRQVDAPGHRRRQCGLGQQRRGPHRVGRPDHRRCPHQAIEGWQRVTRPRPGPPQDQLGLGGEDRGVTLPQRFLAPGHRRPRVPRQVCVGRGAQQAPGAHAVIGRQLRRPPPGPGGRAVPAALPRVDRRSRESLGRGIIGTGGRRRQVPGPQMPPSRPGQGPARRGSGPQRCPAHHHRAHQRMPELDLAVHGAHQPAAFGGGERRQRQPQRAKRRLDVTPAADAIGGDDEQRMPGIFRQLLKHAAPGVLQRRAERQPPRLEAAHPVGGSGQVLQHRERVAAGQLDQGPQRRPADIGTQPPGELGALGDRQAADPQDRQTPLGGWAPGSSRTANNITMRSAARRRAANSRTCRDSGSTH